MSRLDCEDAQRLIHLDLDGEIPPDERKRLEEHLASCPHCRAAQEELSAVDSRLRDALSGIEPPAGLVRSTRRRMMAEQRRRSLLRVVLPAAAAFVLVGTALWFAFGHLDTGRRQITLAQHGAPAVVLSGGDAIHVFEPHERVAQPGQTGAPLPEDSVAWALGEDSTRLAFAGGARVDLSGEAVVRIGRDRIELFKGHLRADTTEAEGPFTISTPWGDVTCRDGIVVVRSDGDGRTAYARVIAGSAVVTADDRQQTLKAGESRRMRIDPDREVVL